MGEGGLVLADGQQAPSPHVGGDDNKTTAGGGLSRWTPSQRWLAVGCMGVCFVGWGMSTFLMGYVGQRASFRASLLYNIMYEDESD